MHLPSSAPVKDKELTSNDSARTIGLYSCTSPHCSKAFCGRDDWKFHEMDEHYQSPVWLCMLCMLLKSANLWHYRSEEEFQEHTSQHEDINLEYAIKQGYVGKNYQQSFWCGFCVRVVCLNKKSNAAWDERFSHIEEHYNNGLSIYSWVCYEKKGPKYGMGHQDSSCNPVVAVGCTDTQAMTKTKTSIIDSNFVTFTDLYGLNHQVPYADCWSIENAKHAITRELGVNGDEFTFWVEQDMAGAGSWAEKVKPDTTVTLRLSPRSTLLSSRPPSPSPSPSPIQNPTQILPLLSNISEIWNAEGSYQLSFPKCEHRTFQFIRFTIEAGLQWLKMYGSFRKLALPEKWCDLGGNPTTGFEVDGFDCPEVNVGPVLSGLDALNEIEDVIWVLVLKGRVFRRARDGSLGVHNDRAFKWVAFPSLVHAQEGIKRSLGNGYSIVGHWAELKRDPLGRLIGETLEDSYAVIGLNRDD